MALALFSVKAALAAMRNPRPTARETPYAPAPENLEQFVAQPKNAH
jgi:carbon starvation protein